MKQKFELQMPQMPVELVRNVYGLRIRKCCASCAYQEEGRLVTIRTCKKKETEVSPCECCRAWKMNPLLMRAGKGEKGEVKRYEYLMYVLAEREDDLALEDKDTPEEDIESKLEEIRMKFEQEHSSIYINI